MENLIEALNIFKKYKNNDDPIMCALRTLMINHVTKKMVSKEDQEKLNELGFEWDDDYKCWLMNIKKEKTKSLKA